MCWDVVLSHKINSFDELYLSLFIQWKKGKSKVFNTNLWEAIDWLSYIAQCGVKSVSIGNYVLDMLLAALGTQLRHRNEKISEKYVE